MDISSELSPDTFSPSKSPPGQMVTNSEKEHNEIIESDTTLNRDPADPIMRTISSRNEDKDTFSEIQTDSGYDQNNPGFSKNLLNNEFVMHSDDSVSVLFQENIQSKDIRYGEFIYGNNFIEDRVTQFSSAPTLHDRYSDDAGAPALGNCSSPSLFNEEMIPSPFSLDEIPDEIINNGKEINFNNPDLSEPGPSGGPYRIPIRPIPIGFMSQNNVLQNSASHSHPTQFPIEERNAISCPPMEQGASSVDEDNGIPINPPDDPPQEFIPDNSRYCLEGDFLLPLFYGEPLRQVQCKNIPGHKHFINTSYLVPRFADYLTFLDGYVAGAYGCFVTDTVALLSIRAQDAINLFKSPPEQKQMNFSNESNEASASETVNSQRENQHFVNDALMSPNNEVINEPDSVDDETIDENQDPGSGENSHPDNVAINDGVDIPYEDHFYDEHILLRPDLSVPLGFLARQVFSLTSSIRFIESPIEDAFYPSTISRCVNHISPKTSKCLKRKSPLVYGVRQPESECQNVPGHVHFYGTDYVSGSLIKKFLIFIDGYIAGAYGCMAYQMHKLAEESTYLQVVAIKQFHEQQKNKNPPNESENSENEIEKDEPINLVVRKDTNDASHSSKTENTAEKKSVENPRAQLKVQQETKHSTVDVDSDNNADVNNTKTDRAAHSSKTENTNEKNPVENLVAQLKVQQETKHSTVDADSDNNSDINKKETHDASHSSTSENMDETNSVENLGAQLKVQQETKHSTVDAGSDNNSDINKKETHDASHSSTSENMDETNSVEKPIALVNIQRKRKHSTVDADSDNNSDINNKETHDASHSSTSENMDETNSVEKPLALLNLQRKRKYSTVNADSDINNKETHDASENKDETDSVDSQEAQFRLQRKRIYAALAINSDNLADVNNQERYNNPRFGEDPERNTSFRRVINIQNTCDNNYLDLSTKPDCSELNTNNSRVNFMSPISHIFGHRSYLVTRMISNNTFELNQHDNFIAEFQDLEHESSQSTEEEDIPQILELDEFDTASNSSRDNLMEYQEFGYFNFDQEEFLSILHVPSQNDQNEASGSNENNHFQSIENETSVPLVSSSCSPVRPSTPNSPHDAHEEDEDEDEEASVSN